jgi:hypothetical protein
MLVAHHDSISSGPGAGDFDVFGPAGRQGLNFALIGGPSYYHTPRDTPENLSLRSLQHQGSYALALALYFGHIDLDHSPKPNRIYFDVFGQLLVHYPEA